MDYRTEHDTMGDISVPAQALWGAQTQRSLQNFAIGEETMPLPLLEALTLIKRACATANCSFDKINERTKELIHIACDEILSGQHSESFPLSVWQTGSGTQTNMNLNEVIANRGNQISGKRRLHPNDHVNLSQSSNDSFPSALHVAALREIHTRLFPTLDAMRDTLLRLEVRHASLVKTGRTHLQDAVPLSFGQEVSAWRCMLDEGRRMTEQSNVGLRALALGGTAVGTGLNAPRGFSEAVCEELSRLCGLAFVPASNKFHALSSKDALTFSHGALRTLAANLLKMANDIRWLASGPRCGLGEILLPENEPGSSIMPGKVNPTQCEALSMVCLQVLGNDAAISMAASQGNFQLNVYMPLIGYNYLQSVRLLSDAMDSFTRHCLTGLLPNKEKMRENLARSLMTVTALTPHIGYENGAKVAKLAHRDNISLKEATLALELLDEAEFDRLFHPEEMI